MGSIGLPTKPTKADYEDCVAAMLTSKGYFTECNLVLQETPGAHVLELDIVATPSGENYLDRSVLEVKSGQFGFSDLFKVSGWMHYLGLESGCFVYSEPCKANKLEAMKRVSERTRIRAVKFDVNSDEDFATLASDCTIMDAEARNFVGGSAWYHRIGERLAGDQLTTYCNSNPCEETDMVKRYRAAIGHAFFADRPLRRARDLYDTYGQFPKMFGKLAEYVASKRGCTTRDISNAAWYSGDHYWLQYLMSLESRSRIAILKNALDFVIEDEQRASGTDARLTKLGERALMPGNFLAAMQQLRKHEHRKRIPFFFQAFVDVLGGFYLDNDEDLSLVATVTGVPADAVVGLLDLWDQLYPIAGGWRYRQGDIVMMKVLPAYVRGAGCFTRHSFYRLGKDYSNLSAQNGDNLANWHNALLSLLESRLAGHAPESDA